MSVNTLYQQCIHHDQPGTLQQDVREQTNRIENLILSRLPLKVQAGSIDAETSTESISESINLYVSSVVCTSGIVHAVPIATTINDEHAETRAAGILNELGKVMKDAGGELLQITKGSIRFHLRFQSLENLQRFKEKCLSGELGRELAGILLSDDIKKDAGSDELAIQVTFSENEYRKGLNFFKNIGKDVKDIRVQLPTRIREWSKEHVREWLLQNDFSDSVATQFYEEDVTGKTLLVYTSESLYEDFKLPKGPARIILNLRDEGARTTASSSSSKGETINYSSINKVFLNSSENTIIYFEGNNVKTQSCNSDVSLEVIDAESGVNMDSKTEEVFDGLKACVTQKPQILEKLAAIVEDFGGRVLKIYEGSIRMVVQFCHLKGLDTFHEKCLSGELAAELSKILLTEDIQKSADCELAISVAFEHSQYRKGRSYFMNTDTTEFATQVDLDHSEHHHEQATSSSETKQPLQPCTELFEPYPPIPIGTEGFQTQCAHLDGEKRQTNLADHVFEKGTQCSNNVVHLPRYDRIRSKEMTACHPNSSTTGKRSKEDEDSNTTHTSQMTTHQQVLRPKGVARIPRRRRKTTGPHSTHTRSTPEVLPEVTRTVSLPLILFPSDDLNRAIKHKGQSMYMYQNVKMGLQKNKVLPKGHVLRVDH